MTDGEKYARLLACEDEYRARFPHDVARVEIVATGRSDYPEIVEIHWKSGGKSGIGNPKMVELAKPLVGDVAKFCEAAKAEIRRQCEELEPAAKAEAERTRPWTYVLGVLDDNGNRVERYSWYETNSWELYGMTDQAVLDQEMEQCRDFRSRSTSRWHVYRRMKGSTKLEEVY